jgi:dienelactone hydrolase
LSCVAEIRTCTSTAGQTIEAEFLNVENGRVILRGADGKRMNVSYDALSEDDQAFIVELYKKFKEETEKAKKEAEEQVEKEKAEKKAAFLAKWPPGKIVDRVTTNGTETAYYVYIPSSFDPDNLPPLLYTFSPGGNGKGALRKVQQSAEKAGWIVVGCDKLQNNMEETTGHKIEDDLFSCVAADVPYDHKRVYLSGMSGGGMRSYQIASRRQDLKFTGILAFGGWIGGKVRQKDLKLPKGGGKVAIINGDEDKNANSWVESDSETIRKKKWKVNVFNFLGGHIYPPAEIIDQAISWMLEEP